MSDVLYRYVERYKFSLDDLFTPSLYIVLEEYPVIKTTQCGKWIQYHGRKKFVLSTSKKRFAYPTKHLAKESFVQRKRSQVRLLEEQLLRAKTALMLGETNIDSEYELQKVLDNAQQNLHHQ